MEDVVAPVLQSNAPAAVADKFDVPSQLLVTLTVGADGIAIGAAVPVLTGLVHPFTVVVTLYVPATATVTEDVVAPVLHSNEPAPAARVDNLEVPQLSTSVTTGAEGVVFGAAGPVPDALGHPFTVWVTL